MSELQLGLLVAGAIVVIGVVVHNKWQELRARKLADKAWKLEHPDVLLPTGGRVEDESPAGSAELQISSAVSTLPDRNDIPDVSLSNRISEVRSSIDCLLSFPLQPARQGQGVITAAIRALGTAPKSVQLEGLAAGTVEWEPIRHNGTYAAIRAGIQLVDRRGCVSQEELQAFSMSVAELAKSLGADLSPVDTQTALEAAHSLDRFCADVDIQVAVHVTGKALSGTKIRAFAEANGFVADEDGRYRRRDHEGRVLFCISNDEAAPLHADTMRALTTTSISLELDVPRAPGGMEVITQYKVFAQQLASTLDGVLVDDRRSPITAPALERIGVEVQSVWNMMNERGIPAGSPLALRLFS